jgi:hypothetical protein
MPPSKCPHRGSQISNQDSFCAACGKPLGTQTPRQPQAPYNGPPQQADYDPRQPQPTYHYGPPPPRGQAPPAKRKTRIAPAIYLALVGGFVLVTFIPLGKFMENAHPDRDTGSNPSSASGPDQTGSVPAFSTSAVSVSTDYETGLVSAEKIIQGQVYRDYGNVGLH